MLVCCLCSVIENTRLKMTEAFSPCSHDGKEALGYFLGKWRHSNESKSFQKCWGPHLLHKHANEDRDGTEKVNRKGEKKWTKDVVASWCKSLSHLSSSVSPPAILGDYNIFRRATCTSSCRVNSKIYSEGMCQSLMHVQYSYDSISKWLKLSLLRQPAGKQLSFPFKW